MEEPSNKMEVTNVGQIGIVADDKTWVLVQDSNGQPRLITQDELLGNIQNSQQMPDILGPNIVIQQQESCMPNAAVDMNNNAIQGNSNVDSTTYTTGDDIETLRSYKHEQSMEKKDCLATELNYKNPNTHIELVMDEDLDSSLANDGSILEHISRQIAIQQPYLNPDSSGHPLTYHIEEIPIEALEGNPSFSDSFTLVPNVVNQPQQNWYHTSPQTVDLRIPSQKGSFEPATLLTPTNHNQKRQTQPVQFIPARNSTPVGMHSILQPIGTNESGRYVYTPHPKTGQLMYMSEGASSQLYTSRPVKAPTPQRKSKGTNTCKPVPKQKTPPASVSKKPVTPQKEDKENTSPDSSKSPTGLDLDFPLFSNSVCEESREQHNLKERKRRARIKDACEVMRKLVPGMSDKTDKATVFEFAARYIHYQKGFTGNKHDKDFLLKYSPY